MRKTKFALFPHYRQEILCPILHFTQTLTCSSVSSLEFRACMFRVLPQCSWVYVFLQLSIASSTAGYSHSSALNKLHCITLRSSFSNNSDCNPNTVNTITQNWYIRNQKRRRRRYGDMVALNPIKRYDGMDGIHTLTHTFECVYKKERAKLLALNCYWHWIFRL